jgi:hypothetical protein
MSPMARVVHIFARDFALVNLRRVDAFEQCQAGVQVGLCVRQGRGQVKATRTPCGRSERTCGRSGLIRSCRRFATASSAPPRSF